MSRSSKIYIASDFHLGIDANLSSKDRERKIIKWLDLIKLDAATLILNGDTFDYWFEYHSVIPKGFYRFISKLSELSEAGIDIVFFTGNHDMWLFDYFKKEVSATIYKEPQIFDWGGKKFFVGHGDGLGPGDHFYKFIKIIFSNRFCQWLYKRIHPNVGLFLMKFFSKQSRERQDLEPYNKDNERLYSFCEEQIKKEEIDYFIFGHRHLPIKQTLSNQKSVYYNSGDWLFHYSYIEIEDGQVTYRFFENENTEIYGD